MTKVRYYWIVELSDNMNVAAKKGKTKTKNSATHTQISHVHTLYKRYLKTNLSWEQQSNKEVRITRGKLQ